ncbi:MAG: gliding motility lipoprotein GldH [Flavobacteriaceae bacterium]|nr:gliding motility lipoprotein GldH [Flavobacteriaceae bacterium]
MQYLKIIFLFIIIISISSCTKNMVYDQFQNIEDAEWHKDSIINFTINSVDTISKNNIYINLRNNKDYEFSNLFLIVGIKFPNNYQIVDTLEYEMTSPEGRFLGTGITDIKENKLEYKTGVNFPVKGDYKISIQQAMRKTRNIDGLEYLNGIADVGLQIEKAN